jgi:hypothetical protein
MASDLPEMPADHNVTTEREQRIREKAYQLWRADGAQEGKADEYWHRAQELIEGGASDPKPSPKQPAQKPG